MTPPTLPVVGDASSTAQFWENSSIFTNTYATYATNFVFFLGKSASIVYEEIGLL